MFIALLEQFKKICSRKGRARSPSAPRISFEKNGGLGETALPKRPHFNLKCSRGLLQSPWGFKPTKGFPCAIVPIPKLLTHQFPAWVFRYVHTLYEQEWHVYGIAYDAPTASYLAGTGAACGAVSRLRRNHVVNLSKYT